MRIAWQLGLAVDIVFDPNNHMLTVDEAVDQLLMLMYNQYADWAVLSLRRLHNLLGVRAAYTHSVTDRPVLPWPYRMILRGGVTVLEGAGILARGTGSCT